MNLERDYGIFESDQRIVAHSRYFAGLMGSHFFVRLRDEQKIVGVRCEKCNKVFWPPRSTCGRCFSKLSPENLTEIGPFGTLETFTMVKYSEPVHPRKAPFVYGIIKLDGSDTSMVHFVDGVDFEKLAPGMRLRPVFANKRNGNILDIDHFEPLDSL